MKQSMIAVLILLFLASGATFAQDQQEKIDSLALAKIKEEGLKNSQVMDLLSYLCDVYSPRLAWSPEYKTGADWVSSKLKEWGLQNIYYDRYPVMGKGWTLKNFSAMVTAPVAFPVIAYPAAWSPGFKEKEADVVYLDVNSADDFKKYEGKLKGKYVLISEPIEVRAHFEPVASRIADSLLLRMANADLQGGRRGGPRGPRFPRFGVGNIDSALIAIKQANPDIDTAQLRRRMQQQSVAPRKLEFVQKEGAIAAITAGQGDLGTVLVQSASVPQPAAAPGAPPVSRVSAYDAKAPDFIPQVVFAAEHYNRLVREIQRGQKVKLEMELQVEMTKADSGFSVIAEIPGTDLKDEVVMLGAHFDTWHAGTGATDDNSGTGACMEAVRILKKLAEKDALKTRRTIRIGLWGAEEEGLIGSREYVSEMFAKREAAQGQAGGAGGFGGATGQLKTTPLYDKFYVYFNHDNGTGRIRGIYLQGNESARPIFRRWLTAYGDPTAQTITIQNTGGTDHQSFDGVGLPGFQFIQDPIDYDRRTHHYNMDVYDRLQDEDMKQAATVMAFFAYQAANRDGKFPRKGVQASGMQGPGGPPPGM